MFYGFNVNNLNFLIMNSLMTQGDLKQKDLASKLVCFNVNGVNTFQGLRSRVTICSILLYVCIVWHIKPILWYKPSQTYLWFLTLKFFYNVSMVILIIAPKGIWSLPKWQRLWKLKATKFCKTLRQDGYLLLVLLNVFCLNIALFS